MKDSKKCFSREKIKGFSREKIKDFRAGRSMDFCARGVVRESFSFFDFRVVTSERILSNSRKAFSVNLFTVKNVPVKKGRDFSREKSFQA